MWQRLLLALSIGFLPGTALGQEASKQPSQEGANVPASFQPYNVTGPRKGHFHCPVTEYDLDPVVLVFVRGLDLAEPTRDLLRQLEQTVAANQGSRLRGVLVLLSNDLPEVAGATNETQDKLDELAQKAEDLAKGLGLKKVLVCLAGKRVQEKYSLDPSAPLTVVMYRRLRILHSETVPREQLTAEKVKQLMGRVAKEFGAK
jgi:hypothetical protein